MAPYILKKIFMILGGDRMSIAYSKTVLLKKIFTDISCTSWQFLSEYQNYDYESGYTTYEPKPFDTHREMIKCVNYKELCINVVQRSVLCSTFSCIYFIYL